ncbi:ReoY family proteolytic degradation factor [Virgibacillus sp. 179-BFC.A HS]|uniref:UPF0302 protein P5G51_010165 n=1 Tax=Tigheibacillus jepli TaxID=3035914 RepID=A0ABU5CH79_9BACI|nr:ReoY family proteolytic degradation factor [Virgibacillus sp. 179-BFC.A HS]MDY0405707.1 ReoY family proteolytic degradation factor [Virgibacillus sp. 179-BFC.A HS]
MQTPISVNEKKNFIQWFLNHYQLKKRESVWILNYLINHDDILEHIHFVREAKLCPRSIIISSDCSKEVPFRFYKNHIVTTDAEKSFHDIRLNRDEDLFIELHFKNDHQNAMYVAVLEENPFIPPEHSITKQDEETANNLLHYILYEHQIKRIKEKIDRALDERNNSEFARLSEKLREIKASQPKTK